MSIDQYALYIIIHRYTVMIVRLFKMAVMKKKHVGSPTPCPWSSHRDRLKLTILVPNITKNELGLIA